jgi:hypothetical protein
MGLERPRKWAGVRAPVGAQGRRSRHLPTPPLCGLPGEPTANKAAAKQNASAFTPRCPAAAIHPPLLKTLLTSACERNCAYCPSPAGRNHAASPLARRKAGGTRAAPAWPRAVPSADHRRRRPGASKLLDTIDILRRKHHFGGYVHLKFMRGAERDQVYRAMHLADRLSV